MTKLALRADQTIDIRENTVDALRKLSVEQLLCVLMNQPLSAVQPDMNTVIIKRNAPTHPNQLSDGQPGTPGLIPAEQALANYDLALRTIQYNGDYHFQCNEANLPEHLKEMAAAMIDFFVEKAHEERGTKNFYVKVGRASSSTLFFGTTESDLRFTRGELHDALVGAIELEKDVFEGRRPDLKLALEERLKQYGFGIGGLLPEDTVGSRVEQVEEALRHRMGHAPILGIKLVEDSNRSEKYEITVPSDFSRSKFQDARVMPVGAMKRYDGEHPHTAKLVMDAATLEHNLGLVQARPRQNAR